METNSLDINLNCVYNEDFWSNIIKSYKSDTNTAEPSLSKEISIIRDAIKKHFDDNCRYLIVDFLGIGGVGIVFKAWDKKLKTFRAIKIARPIEGREEMVKGLVEEEISRLQEVSHPNIISIYDVGEIDSSNGKLPFYAMTFLKGALNGRSYFEKERTTEQLLKFIDGLLSGVTHLHSINLLHLDLKPSNIFVREDGFAVIGDLGGARKKTDDNPEEEVLVTCTYRYAHPELQAYLYISSSNESNRKKGNLKRKLLKFEFDQYSVGLCLFETIRSFEVKNPTRLSSYQKKYLNLQAARLLDGHAKPEERPLGLTDSTLKKIKYNSIKSSLEDFYKLLGRINLINDIPELTPAADSIIQVSRGRRTRITPRLTRLLGYPLIRRLSSISQLGLVRLVYPGATHTRFEHSLGTYSNAANYIRSLYYDPINPFFKQIMSKDDLICALLGALLHDIGQYQHAHDLQDVDPAIFKHEELTLLLLKCSWADHHYITKPLYKLIEDDWKIKPERITTILEANPNHLTTDIKDRILHTVISGPIDVDKIDYLVRDSDNCQTVFAQGLDFSRLLSILTIVYQQKGSSDEQYFALGIHEKGRAAAESVGFIRYQMYNAVYWHHTVRAAKAMLQRATFEWIEPFIHNPSKDTQKRKLHDFILNYSPAEKDKTLLQNKLFLDEPIHTSASIGYSSNPQWAGLCHSDFSFLQWLFNNTNQLGKDLISSIAKRELYKRIFVISALQSKSLWDKIQHELKDYENIKKYSEILRTALKIKLDELIKKSLEEIKEINITGYGDGTLKATDALAVLGKPGSVLIDVPRIRNKEELHFFPEDMHRSQKEEFESPSLLGVSELWHLVSDKLHENAGNIRIFVHPDIAILKSAKLEGNKIFDSSMIEAEIRKIFEVD